MTDNIHHSHEQLLESWKEIATYLKRDVRTVIRWEKTEGLPVHRQMHQARGSVFAYPSELETWKGSRELRVDTVPPLTPWRRAVSAAGFALVLLVALGTVSSGPILTPTRAAAQQFKGVVNRQVWGGAGVDILGSVSSDGRSLSFVDWDTGDLAVRDLEAGKNRRLTNAGGDFSEHVLHSVMSADGKQVAYSWMNNDGFYDLRLISVDGSKPRVLYTNKGMEYVQPTGWSPDGKEILAIFCRKDLVNQIVLIAVADGSARVLKTLDWRIPMKTSFSPDGRYIAYDLPPQEDATNGDIFLLSADGKRESTLVEHPANDLYPVWTPDGKHILFASDRTGSLGVWIIPVADGQPQGSAQLVKQDVGGRIVPLGFAREGSFYYGLETGMMDVYTASLDFQTGELLSPPRKATERFVGSNSNPDWSPDGRYLAYISRRGPLWQGSYVVCIRSLETGEERDLSPKLSYIFTPRWSPDGRSILLLGLDRKYRRSLYLMDVQSGKATPLVQTGVSEVWSNILWSSDGKAIFYLRQESGSKTPSIVVREVETGQEKEVCRASAGSFINSFAVSPDGRWIVFRFFDQAPGLVGLKVVPSAGGAPRELVRLEKGENIPGFGPLVWSPDGSQVLFTKGGTSPQGMRFELWRVPVEGGKPQRADLAMDGLRDVRIHPDGRRITFSAGRPESAEVWVMENFLPTPRAAK
jgi:Tol biopolymer transport system component